MNPVLRRTSEPLCRRVPIVALAALVCLVGCGSTETETALEAPRVLVASVITEDYEERIEASGELEAKDRASIASEVAGAVTEIAVDEGDPVEAGALLLAIDPEKRELEVANARAMLQESAAALAEAERDAERVRRLHAQGIASEANLDAAETGLARARSRHAASRAQLGVSDRALRDASVRAPFAGIVARREVSRGEYVTPGQVLFEIVSLDPIELEFNLAERDSARVKLGQPVRVTVAPFPGETFLGNVSVISPVLDARTRTLRVKARIDNADGRLRPGLFARADLGVAQRPGLLWVPEEAILLRAQGQIVWVVDGQDRVRKVLVEAGIHDGERVEVVSGLGPADEIVVRGHAGLQDGIVVSRRSTEGAPAGSGVDLASDAEEAAGAL